MAPFIFTIRFSHSGNAYSRDTAAIAGSVGLDTARFSDAAALNAAGSRDQPKLVCLFRAIWPLPAAFQ